MQSMSQSQETTASMTAELQEEQAMLDEPDALFETLMKQAMKLSRHEAEEWQTVKRRRKSTSPLLSLSDSENAEEEEELRAAKEAPLAEAASAAEQQAQAAQEDTPAERKKKSGRARGPRQGNRQGAAPRVAWPWGM
jgi:hypothetical protein